MHYLCPACFEKLGHDDPSSDGKRNDSHDGQFKVKWP